jgi:hypothetical protein
VCRRVFYLLILCIASVVLLVSASARASIAQAHQGGKSAPSCVKYCVKTKNNLHAVCTYQIASLTAGTHKKKVALILTNCGGTPSVWGWPGQNPIRYRDPTGHWGDGDPRADAWGDASFGMSTGEKAFFGGLGAIAFGGVGLLALEGTALGGWLGFGAPAVTAAGQKLNEGGCSATSATAGRHIALGLDRFGIQGTADRLGAETLLKDQNWRETLSGAIADPSSRFTVSLDGLTGSSPYSQVMTAVQQGISPNASPTNWELAQLYQAGLLPSVNFVSGGANLPNPFAP